jgi:hypothetical protein
MISRQYQSRFFLVTLVALGMLAAACGGHGAQVGDGGTQHDGAPPNCTQPGLFLVSPQAVNLSAAAQSELKVRYACDSQPYSGMLVAFEIVGDGKGSALSAASSQTDTAGEAAVTLTAGTQAATFEVKASAAGAASLTFSITVNTSNVGTISVTMHYSGLVAFTKYQAYLFQNKQCTAIDAFQVTGAVQQATPVAILSAKPQFINVTAGAGYTVAVVATKGADVLGFGCTPSITVTAGAKTDTDVTLEDIPVTYSGVYDLDNHFDLNNLLPPSVGNIVDIFDEMTDDNQVNGSVSLDQWGVDPAAFLLDFVYKQFCHWECTNANPSWSNCTPGTHAMGDLKETYRGMYTTPDFKSWDGDQPLFTGACGILDQSWGANQWIQGQVQGLITTYIPDVVLNVIQMIGDLARAINHMHVKSVLTLNDIRPGRQGNFSHVLASMLFDLHDLGGTVHNIEVDLGQAGVGNLSYSGNTTVVTDKLQIPSHTFQIKFGKLVQYIYLEALLPLLGYTSTADMFQHWVDCDSVGTWLHDELVSIIGTSPSATTLAGYCDTGLQAAGTYIDNSIANWITASTDFTLEGWAAASAVNDHRIATQLDGVPPTAEEGWAGHWVEGSANANFTGTFTGVRR